MQNCPRHPDQETMVPCIGCGRYFCRLCEPPRGAGQYCSSCYEKSVESLKGKGEPGKKAEGSAVGRWWRKINQPVVIGKAKKEAAPGTPATEPASGDRPATDKRGSVPVRKERWSARKVRGVGRALVGAWEAVRRFFVTLVHLPGRGLAALWKLLLERFPLGATDTERLEGGPPLREAWFKLLAVTLGSSLIWIIVVVVTQHRRPFYSWVIAAVVAGGVAWAMGMKFDWKVGVISCLLALFALGLSEMVVILLFKVNVIKRLDVFSNQLILMNKFHNNFLILDQFLLQRMLPSAVVSFVIGWWPLARRPRWRGFGPNEVVHRTRGVPDEVKG